GHAARQVLLLDAESLGRLREEVLYMLHRIDRRNARGELQPLDTVLDVLDPQDRDRTDLARGAAVRARTGLHVPGHLDNPDLLARRDTALVQAETVLLLGTRPLLPGDVDRGVVHHDLVRADLDPLQFLGRDVLEVSDIDPGRLAPLLGAGLVDMSTKHLLRRV